MIFAAFAAATANGQQSSAAGCPLNGLAAVPAARQGDVREFEKRVKSGSFYQELARRFGAPEACATTFDDGEIGLSFSYRGGARLNAAIDTQIEYSEQTVRFSGMTAQSAIALLKKAETNAFGNKGCGIVWKAPAETIAGERVGSREAVYRGGACNCQAKVIYEGSSVVGLALSSAC